MKTLKVALHSDLHSEFHKLPDNFLVGQELDVIVLAGDIGTLCDNYLSAVFALVRKNVGYYPHVIFVPGNHEYHGSTFDRKTKTKIRNACNRFDVTILDRAVVNIKGMNFAGATCWSMADSVKGKEDPAVNYLISRGWDFKAIKGFTIDKMIKEGKKDKAFFESMFRTKEPWVAISHFSPLVELGNQHFPVDTYTNYFCNDFSGMIVAGENKPQVWMFGHTHGNFDEVILNVPFVSNQRGYPAEEVGGNPFNPTFTIEMTY